MAEVEIVLDETLMGDLTKLLSHFCQIWLNAIQVTSKCERNWKQHDNWKKALIDEGALQLLLGVERRD